MALGDEATRGPWLAYLFRPDGSTCWLALGWRPFDEAGEVRGSLQIDGDDHFRLGPIRASLGRPELVSSVLVSVGYRAGTLPPEHRLVNDLHAMVVLHDLLSEDAAPSA